jgi:hypothetical protein
MVLMVQMLSMTTGRTTGSAGVSGHDLPTAPGNPAAAKFTVTTGFRHR